MSFSSNETSDINSMKQHKESDEYLVSPVYLTPLEFSRIRTFYGSKLSEPLICDCTVSVFTTFDMANNICPSTDSNSSHYWSRQAQGALILQKTHDKELYQDYSGARLIVSSVKTCDLLWSVSLYSWNEYQCMTENFHKFYKWTKDSDIEDVNIGENYSVGIYFPIAEAAEKFLRVVSEYIDQITLSKDRTYLEKKKAIKDSRSSDKKHLSIKKSSISAPIMFTHTLHLDKSS